MVFDLDFLYIMYRFSLRILRDQTSQSSVWGSACDFIVVIHIYDT